MRLRPGAGVSRAGGRSLDLDLLVLRDAVEQIGVLGRQRGTSTRDTSRSVCPCTNMKPLIIIQSMSG